MVILGRYNRLDKDESGKEIKYVAEVKIHENWDSQTGVHYDDVALLRLVSKVHFNEYIQPVCILTSEIDVDYEKMVGRGISYSNTASSGIPKWVDFKISNMKECLLNNPDFGFFNWKNFFCARDLNRVNGNIDHGLFVEIEKRTFLKGLPSTVLSNHGLHTHSNRYDMLFTDIPQYFNFIKVKSDFFFFFEK